MPTVNDLQAVWPFISANPWEALTIFTMGLGIGFGIAKAWQELTKTKAPQKPALTPPAEPAPRLPGGTSGRPKVQEPFAPSPLQVQCIKALRWEDDEWLSAGEVARRLLPRQPRSDVEQALAGLVTAGWAADLWGTLSGREFRLSDGGLDFARSQGFPVREPDY